MYTMGLLKTVLEAMKHRDGFQFLNQKWQNDEEFVNKTSKTFLDKVCYTGFFLKPQK